MSDLLDFAAVNQLIRNTREYLQGGAEWTDPRPAKQIAKRHRERHDHTDETPRCICGRFLPKEQGHNRVVCSCGKPNTVWVGKDE